jgi:hypothetical protein
VLNEDPAAPGVPLPCTHINDLPAAAVVSRSAIVKVSVFTSRFVVTPLYTERSVIVWTYVPGVALVNTRKAMLNFAVTAVGTVPVALDGINIPVV